MAGGQLLDAVRPFVAIWDRFGGKSTCAESGLVAVAARRTRRFGLYVSSTQDSANTHLRDVRERFESPLFGRDYARIADRKITRYGYSSGWTQSELHTADGFAVVAIGLDKAVRGIKYVAQRPDFIIFDDIDELDDNELATAKKIDTITRTILPAGSADVAVLFVQNLILPHGVAAQLASDDPPFLSDRILSGPIPAVYDAVLTPDRKSLLSGTPSWKTVEEINADIRRMSADAWLAECQHEVGLRLKEGLVYGEDSEGIAAFEPRRNVRTPAVSWAGCKWRIAAIDPGGADPSAVVALGVAPDERLHVYAIHHVRGGIDDLAVNELLGRWEQELRGRFTRIVKDAAGGASAILTLRRMGWPVVAADKAREEIAYVQGLFRSGRLTIDPACYADVEREIGSYWWEDRIDRTRGTAPSWATKTSSDHHADVLDAIRYAVVAVKHGLPGVPMPAGQVGSGHGPRLAPLGGGTMPRPLTLRERVLAR